MTKNQKCSERDIKFTIIDESNIIVHCDHNKKIDSLEDFRLICKDAFPERFASLNDFTEFPWQETFSNIQSGLKNIPDYFIDELEKIYLLTEWDKTPMIALTYEDGTMNTRVVT